MKLKIRKYFYNYYNASYLETGTLLKLASATPEQTHLVIGRQQAQEYSFVLRT
jgi:hypothetical protein